VESALDVLAEKAARKKLDLIYSAHPLVPDAIVCDPTRLRQVIINLLSNSVKVTITALLARRCAPLPLLTC
jgi:signal transduction histidine kinase